MRAAHRAWLIVAVVLACAALVPQQSDVRVLRTGRSLQPGEVIQFTVVTTTPAERVQVDAFGRGWPAFRVDATTWRFLVGIDLDVMPRTYTAVLTVETAGRAKPARLTRQLPVAAKKFGTRTLTVDAAFVNPPAEVEARIAAESARLGDLWKQLPGPRAWTDGFERPVGEDANSAFGKRTIFNGQVRNPHTGADFPSAAGAAVGAPNAGTVVLADSLYLSGNTVILDHGLGLFSTLAHLSVIDVRAGDVVTRGQRVGAVGATGRVTAAHLHWAVRLNGARVDPLSLIWVTAQRAP